MRRVVFYSWQSDLPSSTNRGFIQDALEKAAAGITADESIAVEPVVDRDTQGVPGAPDIASTIFAKITAADVFVADVSITARPVAGRAAPNPNVLIELGYALKALGHERVILVFNRAFGTIEELPFDLRTRRLTPYEMSVATSGRGTARRELQGHFDAALRAALGSLPPPTPTSIPAVSAIEATQPNRIIVVRQDLSEILTSLDAVQPTKHSAGGTVEELIDAIGRTQEPIAGFSKIARAISIMQDREGALECFRWFGRLVERYHLPEGFEGRYSEADWDYWRFVGHEMFVTLVAYLLKEERWETLAWLLDEHIPIGYLRRSGGPGYVSWNDISECAGSLDGESRKRRRISLHADILHERHTRGGLAAGSPFNEFVAADFLLYLRGEAATQVPTEPALTWRAWSCLYLKALPLFVRAAERTAVAESLGKAVLAPTVSDLRIRIGFARKGLRMLFGGSWDIPTDEEDLTRIGTR